MGFIENEDERAAAVCNGWFDEDGLVTEDGARAAAVCRDMACAPDPHLPVEAYLRRGDR